MNIRNAEYIDSKKYCKNFLKKLTLSKNLFFTKRCNSAIDIALRYAKNKGYTKLAYPYEGGWIHYRKACKKFNFEEIIIDTVNSKVSIDDLEKKIDNKTIFIYHTLGGYFAKNEVGLIEKIVHSKSGFLINDVSGSIGLGFYDEKYSFLYDSKYCDILVSSFGFNKPINFGKGGFISNNFDDVENNLVINGIIEEDLDFLLLKKKLDDLPNRMNYLIKKNQTILNILKTNLANSKNLKVISDNASLVIIVLYLDENSKNLVIDFCNQQKLEYTICPREIRIKKNAISIEIKRLKEEIV